MKKIIYIIIGTLFLLLMILGSNYNKLQDNQDLLRSRLYELEEGHAQVKSNLIVEEATNKKLQEENDNYKLIVERLLDHEHYSDRSKIIRKAYDVKSIVSTHESTFEMPRNGKIIVDSNSVVIDINIDLPPDFTEDFNDMLHRYDHFNYGLLFDKDLASDYQVDDKRIYIKYDNLDLDDRIDIYLSYELQMLLGLSERRIQIIVKENETSEAYLEENVIRKEFDGELIGLYSQKFDYDQEGVSQKVDKGSDMLFNLDFEGAASISYKYEDGIRVKSKVTYQESETIDYLILPEKLNLGTEYHNNRRCVISALNYKLETTMGLLDAVEVSYYENEYLVFKKYYARNLGLVAIDYGNGWDKIVKIDYTK